MWVRGGRSVPSRGTPQILADRCGFGNSPERSSLEFGHYPTMSDHLILEKARVLIYYSREYLQSFYLVLTAGAKSTSKYSRPRLLCMKARSGT